MTDIPLNFASSHERDAWITANANYFTVIRRRGRRYERTEYPTLAEAEAGAKVLLKEDTTARCIIYAVYSPHDAYVKTMAAD